MKILLLSSFFLFFGAGIHAQFDGWVFFADKPGVVFKEGYFDAYAIARKQRLGIPIGTFSDLPVSRAYLAALQEKSDSIFGTSRWLNAAAISATAEQWDQIAALPFVTHIVRYTSEMHLTAEVETEWPELWPMDSLLLEYQTRRLGRDAWRSAGVSGKGVRVGIVDGGFPGVDTHPAFKHMRDNNRILGTYDFLKKDTMVYKHNRHGTAVLSCIAGRYGDSMCVGLAPDVSVVLARTERGITETIAEELAWINAIEWMDQFGVSIVNSSLGYTDRRYFEEDMDGRTSPIVKAANKAVEKGILIINAAGNEGNVAWGTVGTPADGDSVLSVGATDPYTDYATGFSSPGPTADGRLKPNVSAPGIVLAATPRDYGRTSGTSFSAPLVAGFAACVLQHQPDLGPLALMKAVEASGHLYPYFDYHHGYGVPHADKVLGNAIVDSQSFTIKPSGDYINIVVHPKYLPEKDDDDHLLTAPKLIFYHIESTDGRIRTYKVIAAEEEEAYFIEQEDVRPGETVRIHFEGLTKTYTKP